MVWIIARPVLINYLATSKIDDLKEYKAIKVINGSDRDPHEIE